MDFINLRILLVLSMTFSKFLHVLVRKTLLKILLYFSLFWTMLIFWINNIFLAFLRLARLVLYVLNVFFDVGLSLFVWLLIALTFICIQTRLYIEWSCVLWAIRWLINRIHFHSLNIISIDFTTAFAGWFFFAAGKHVAFRVYLAWIINWIIIWNAWVLLQ